MKKTIALSVILLFWATLTQAAPDYFTQINANNLSLNGASGAVVAVLDSGVQLDNSYLVGSFWHNSDEIPNDGLDNDNNGFVDDYNGWDFVASSNDPNPKFDSGYIPEGISHGTAIAGLIVAKDSENSLAQGLAPQSLIMPVRVLSGSGEGDVAGVVKAIKYAVSNGANVINLSFVGYDSSPDLTDTVKWAYDRGVVVVGAAGNGTASSSIGLDLRQTPAYPVCQSSGLSLREIIGVASVNSDNRKSDFSNYGGGCVNLSAPGESLLSVTYKSSSSTDSHISNGYAFFSGTSFSAALVSAAAALLRSQHPNWSAKNIIEALTVSAKNIDAYNSSYPNQIGGLLDIKAALDYQPNLSAGRLIKTKRSTAVYYVDGGGYRYLFTSEAVFFSWFNPPWSQYKIEVVSQAEFDNFKIGRNITARPGSLIKFDNSNLVYAVNNNQRLCNFQNSSNIARLYGSDWLKKVSSLTASFQADYIDDNSCLIDDAAAYPDGSLINYEGSSQVYYIDAGQKFPLASQAIQLNGIKDNWIIKNVKTDINYPDAPIIDSYRAIIFPYKLN